jgi:predicted enzyme related to lactoylglutathione lyase
MSKCEHIELASDNPQQAIAFYSKLFGWKIDQMPDEAGPPYWLFRTDNGGGGITGKMSPDQPTAWLPYITVPSVKKALAAVTKLGGEVVVPYMSIGDMGAIGVLKDPTGGHIGVWETGNPAPAAAKPAKQPAAKKPAAKKPAPKAKAKAKPAKKR